MDSHQLRDAATAATPVGQENDPDHLVGGDFICQLAQDTCRAIERVGQENDHGHLMEGDLVCQLAQDTCRAIERDDVAGLYAVLNIPADEDGPSRVRDVAVGGADGNESSDYKCRQILAVFYSLIGCGECNIGQWSIPLSVKAHLLLRALLRIPHEKYVISWEAANAAIQSLQYSKNDHQSGKSVLSHGEELAMIAEIRSFLTYLKAGSYEQIVLSQTMEQLRILSGVILAPLQLNGEENKQKSQRRRHNSYLLPLDLIPTIISSMDALDDVEFWKNKDRANLNDTVTSIYERDDTLGEVRIEEEGMMQIRASDNLLSFMFASYKREDSCDESIINLDRTIRADAVLPLLSLAIDDIGLSRMSISLGGITYWDRLKFAICDVLNSNLICYSTDVGSIDTSTFLP
ncbi:hypothetical protein ACHAXA_006200 [Cyclostephanos tholiformis]|uniref:Uncharacterized protein n=1 Tax=Cyclostephanos tholiformis TaxID=382380 RepID=A0ABD3RRI8_9STRA